MASHDEKEASLVLKKVAIPSTYNTVGSVVMIVYMVTNNGGVTIYDVKSSDGCGVARNVAPGDTFSFTRMYVVTSDAVKYGFVNDVTDVCGHYGSPDGAPVSATNLMAIRYAP